VTFPVNKRQLNRNSHKNREIGERRIETRKEENTLSPSSRLGEQQ
jgi:hypothetical protein